jgi:formiminoglutamase
MVSDLMEEARFYDPHVTGDVMKLRSQVEIIDERVAMIIEQIALIGKIPVVIGGGHNNAYGIIKGIFTALGKKISAINCDPHLDFRPLEGRHSGNGFSYAFEKGYLEKYAVFAMHEQYNSHAVLQSFMSDPEHLFYRTYESIFVREDISFENSLADCIGFLKSRGGECGIELDLDAITNVPSSAKTSSGISALQARQYIHRATSMLDPLYLHIAEGAPVLSHIKADNKTGKLISYLVTDFIKAYGKNNYHG